MVTFWVPSRRVPILSLGKKISSLKRSLTFLNAQLKVQKPATKKANNPCDRTEICSLLFLRTVFCIFCNMCTISSAKHTSQKIEFIPVEEEKQEDVVCVGVPESEPVEQIREKPGIAVGSSDSLCPLLLLSISLCSAFSVLSSAEISYLVLKDFTCSRALFPFCEQIKSPKPESAQMVFKASDGSSKHLNQQ